MSGFHLNVGFLIKDTNVHLLRNKESSKWRGRVLFPSNHAASITIYCLKYVSLGGPAAFLPQQLLKVWGETSLSIISCRKAEAKSQKQSKSKQLLSLPQMHCEILLLFLYLSIITITIIIIIIIIIFLLPSLIWLLKNPQNESFPFLQNLYRNPVLTF